MEWNTALHVMSAFELGAVTNEWPAKVYLFFCWSFIAETTSVRQPGVLAKKIRVTRFNFGIIRMEEMVGSR
jgi:hypothetical protein